MYYNQNDYGHVPYPSPDKPAATVKSGGCGVCCGATVLSLLGTDYPPEKLAPIYRAEGARVSGGTDMWRAAEILCRLGGLICTTTSSEAELIAHLRAGGVAIANVDGDVGPKGVFSSEGHYIVVVGIKPDGRLMIFDVADTSKRYLDPYRAALVQREGKLLLCSPETLDMDTRHRAPNYYLFEEAPMTQDKFNQMADTYLASRGLLPASEWAKAELERAKAAGITDGTRPQALVTRQEAAIMALRARGK